MFIIAGVIGFILGCYIGSFFKSFAFENQEWRIMRWNQDTFGYRPVPSGVKLFRGDKLIMSLELDSSKFPEEGFKVEDE